MSDKKQTREDKRAAALRDNLKKRKAFVKGTKNKSANNTNNTKRKTP